MITVKLTKPYEKNGHELTQLTFDFEKVTGIELINIEEVCRSIYKDFQLWGTRHILHIAGKACNELNYDDIVRLPMKDCLNIQLATINFLSDVISPESQLDILDTPF